MPEFADAHVSAVSACVFLDGPSLTALTADVRGRLVYHNVSAYVSLMGAAHDLPVSRICASRVAAKTAKQNGYSPSTVSLLPWCFISNNIAPR